VEVIVRDLASRAVAARALHNPIDSVNVALTGRIQKDASLTARLPIMTALWLRFVSLPLRTRLLASLYLFIVANLLVYVSWSSLLWPVTHTAGTMIWQYPSHAGLFFVGLCGLIYMLRNLTI